MVVVVKIIKNARASTDELDFQNEISIMSTLRHPNLVLFLGAVLENEPKMLVSEFLDGGSLEDFFECKFKDKMKPFLPPVAMVHRSLLSLLSSLFSLWSTASSTGSSFSLFSLSQFFPRECAAECCCRAVPVSRHASASLCLSSILPRDWQPGDGQVKGRKSKGVGSCPLLSLSVSVRQTYVC